MRLVTLLPIAVIVAAAADGARAVDREVPAGPAALRAPLPFALSVGTGGGGFFEFADPLAAIRPAGFDDRVRDRRQLNVRLDRTWGSRLRAGLAYTWLGWTDAFSSGGLSVGTIDERAHVLLVDVTLRWLRTEHVETYSALAVGAARWQADGTVDGVPYRDHEAGFAFQLRYFGVSVGNERLRLFADLGIGFEGLVVAGVTVRL